MYCLYGILCPISIFLILKSALCKKKHCLKGGIVYTTNLSLFEKLIRFQVKQNLLDLMEKPSDRNKKGAIHEGRVHMTIPIHQ